MSANIKPAASTALVLQDEGGTDVITISTAGNVGVGNGSPTQKLDVTGNINASGALTLGTALAVAEGGTGSTTESAARTALGLEIGSDVQAYDADTAKYDDTTANFTGTLQNGGSNVLVDTDIGSTVQAYDADTAKYDAATANFTGTLQNGGSNVVVDSDIGSTVQAYDADTTKNDVSNTFTANQIISVSDNTNAALRITQTGTGNALVVEDSANPDSTPFVVDANGSLGIGTDSPVSEIHIKNDIPGIFIEDSDGTATHSGTLIVLNSDTLNFQTRDSTNSFIANDYSVPKGASGATDHIWRIGNSEAVRIDSSGNVGIGTNNPLEALDVEGDITQLANAFVASNIYFDGGFKYRGNGYAGVIKLADSAGAGIRFWVAANNTSGAGAAASILEAMRITPSGNALIGYTSSNGSYKLQVNSQIFATSALIATSDGRYKENITSLDGALNLVAQLNPVQFTWKEHPVHEFDRAQPTVGFIAQEVQEVLKDTPYVNSIIKANECLVGEERDEEGNIITEGTTEEFLGIAEGNLIALLTKALQEANAKIDALETRIQALEA